MTFNFSFRKLGHCILPAAVFKVTVKMMKTLETPQRSSETFPLRETIETITEILMGLMAILVIMVMVCNGICYGSHWHSYFVLFCRSLPLCCSKGKQVVYETVDFILARSILYII